MISLWDSAGWQHFPRVPYGPVGAWEVTQFCQNVVFISPYTGIAWARIERGQRQWHAHLAPSAEDPAWLEGQVPGSLLDYNIELRIKELSRPLLEREFTVLSTFTSAMLCGYNVEQSTTESPAMNNTLMERIAQLRIKIGQGDVTDEELREALKMMRADRVTAMNTNRVSRAKGPEVDPDKALADFLS